MVNESDRAELVGIRKALDLLRGDAERLAQRVGALEGRWTTSERGDQRTPTVGPQVSTVNRPVPPRLPTAPVPAVSANSLQPQAASGQGQVGQQPQTNLSSAPLRAESSKPVQAVRLDTHTGGGATRAARDVLPAPPVNSAGADPERGSLEMRVGTYWLVRVGVVMVLTAVVFFGKYAYANFIHDLGPAGKVLMMYLAGGLMVGAGWWLQRGRGTSGESLRNYGEVLFAGGLAAVYFTTYAAHHVERLRIIASPVLDGVLLLGWAGFVVWLADRKKTELLAVFAVGLAFYASAITQVGAFTLFSNLLLTVITVVLLVRNRWISLPSVGLAAAYAGYGFWRFHSPEGWHWVGPQDGLWTGAAFLMCYWAIFTVAVFVTSDEAMDERRRAGMLTANNASFFTLFVLTMAQVESGGFWIFCLVYGGVLLAAALAAHRRYPAQRWVGLSYLLQGLTLGTVGLIAKFSGLQLGLVLAAESVILLIGSHTLQAASLRRSAVVIAGLATGFTWAGMVVGSDSNLALGLGVGLLLAFEAWWTGSRQPELEEKNLRVLPSYFSALGLSVWAGAFLLEFSAPWPLPILVGSGVILTLSIYRLRVPELALLAQSYPILGAVAWLLAELETPRSEPWWVGLSLVAGLLFLTHWWQRQRFLKWKSHSRKILEGTYAALGMLVLLLWLQPKFEQVTWLWVSGLIAVAAAVYGCLTRSAFLAGAGQVFALASATLFLRSLSWAVEPKVASLVPVLTWAALSTGTRLWLWAVEVKDDQARRATDTVASVYGWVALAMLVLWIQRYVPTREHVWTVALLAALIFATAGWFRWKQLLVAAALLNGLAGCWYMVSPEGARALYALSLLWPLALALQQRAIRHWPERFAWAGSWQPILMVAASGGVGWYVTLWVQDRADGFYLTAAWALLAFALFLVGLMWRERVYRWAGLALLGLAGARVVLIDVWNLDALYRTLSFLALGTVLLALGFIYNRFQERIRQWL